MKKYEKLQDRCDFSSHEALAPAVEFRVKKIVWTKRNLMGVDMTWR